MSELQIRQSTEEDLESIISIVAMAVSYMESHGIRQWTCGNPGRDKFLGDMQRHESYVCQRDGAIIGTAALVMRPEPTYSKIYEGAWLKDGRYGVIHRIAVDENVKGCGVAGSFVDYIEKMCIIAGFDSIRVDTHQDNRSMQALIAKKGFTYCGIIYLESGDERLAFEKLL